MVTSTALRSISKSSSGDSKNTWGNTEGQSSILIYKEPILDLRKGKEGREGGGRKKE